MYAGTYVCKYAGMHVCMYVCRYVCMHYYLYFASIRAYAVCMLMYACVCREAAPTFLFAEVGN